MEKSAITSLEKKMDETSLLTAHAKSLLFRIAEPERLAKHDFLLHEGTPCRAIYFVESGLLRTYINKDGREVNLNFTLHGYFVTDLKSIRTGLPADCNIRAMTDTFTWRFEKENLRKLYSESPEVGEFGRQLMEHLLLTQEEHANSFKLQTPTERYHALALQQPELLQKISLTQLASYLGISRETLSRIRKP